MLQHFCANYKKTYIPKTFIFFKMKKTTAQHTIEYIQERPYIKHCLKKGLINYSSLARHISKELNLEKKSSIDAILVAARRFETKISKEISYDKEVKDLLEESEVEVKNKIVVFIIDKVVDNHELEKLQQKIKKESGILYILESQTTYTIITQDKYAKDIPGNIIFKNKGLALIDIKSPINIETTTGVVSYLTSLFAENGVNILEFMSCWCETLFIIDSKDVNKVLDFLKF